MGVELKINRLVTASVRTNQQLSWGDTRRWSQNQAHRSSHEAAAGNFQEARRWNWHGSFIQLVNPRSTPLLSEPRRCGPPRHRRILQRCFHCLRALLRVAGQPQARTLVRLPSSSPPRICPHLPSGADALFCDRCWGLSSCSRRSCAVILVALVTSVCHAQLHMRRPAATEVKSCETELANCQELLAPCT